MTSFTSHLSTFALTPMTSLLDPLGPAGALGSTVDRIFDSNRPLLLAAAAAEGADAVDMGIAVDAASDLERRLEQALSVESAVDVLVCSGGVSMGDRDLVKPLLARRGTVHYGKVVMKPGKPLTFATIPRQSAGGKEGRPLLVFGLPGNPVSAFACFHLVSLSPIRIDGALTSHLSPLTSHPRPRPNATVARASRSE